MSEAVLQVTNLVKKINGITILDHISFEVGQGDCLALIGPNGAGKTTLMSCILGDKKASSGQVFIKGKKGKAQDQIAVLLQENTIPSQLKVKELIAFFQDISENGLSKVEIQALLQFKDDQYQQFADKLSGGQKRLLAFVLCLIGKPDILFLDEPTAGMDTTTRQRFWEIINDLKKSGVTILYSSHYIEEVELWTENWPVISLFRKMATQWRIGMNGPTGLDYQTLFLLIDRHELSKEEAEQMFDDIRTCEAAALEAMFENAR